jgi:hypothetical protein
MGGRSESAWEACVGVLQGVADVILILAALFSLVAFAFLLYAGWTIFQLVKDVKGEVGQLTTSAKDTMQEVQGTTHFVSESIVKPASTAMGYAAAIRATVRALTEEVKRKSRS